MTPLLLTAVLLATQLPSTPGQLQAPRGRVEGVVLKAGSTEPVVGARITLSRPNELNVNTSMSTTGPGNSVNLFQIPTAPTSTGNAPVIPSPIPPMPIAPVLTDSGGRFSFPELEPGTFRLFVHLDGFVRQEYGQRVFPGQGTPLALSAGEILKDLTFRLTPAGNIGGRLVDNLGKPAAGVPLQLLKTHKTNLSTRTNNETHERRRLTFLGFTIYRTQSVGQTVIKTVFQTEGKRFSRAKAAVKERLRRMKHQPVEEQARAVNQILRGHFNYYGLAGNGPKLQAFCNFVWREWKHTLSQRSQQGRLTEEAFTALLEKHPLVRPRIRIPYSRLAAYVRL